MERKKGPIDSRKPLFIKWYPIPDNGKNFSSTLNYRPKSLENKGTTKQRQRSKPRKPHPLLRAYEFQRLLDEGAVKNKAELARHVAISGARVTQIMNLLKLPIEVQELILRLPERGQRRFSEQRLRQR